MQLGFKLINRTLIVNMSGEIDHHTSQDIRNTIDEHIDRENAKNVIFDFSNVTFMDSAGIGIIIGRYKKVSPYGGKVAIAGARPHIKRMLEISGVLKICQMFESINETLISM